MSDPAPLDEELSRDEKPVTPRRRRRRPPNPDQPKGSDGKFVSRSGSGKAAPSRRRSRQRDDLQEPLTQMFTMVGTFWNGIEEARYENHPVPTCGMTLIRQGPAVAAALNAVAQDDDSVYRWLSAMMTGGGWGAVAFAMLPVANAVIATHAAPAMASLAERRRYRAQHVEQSGPSLAPDIEQTIPEPEGETWQPPNVIPDDEP